MGKGWGESDNNLLNLLPTVLLPQGPILHLHSHSPAGGLPRKENPGHPTQVHKGLSQGVRVQPLLFVAGGAEAVGAPAAVRGGGLLWLPV